MKIYRLLNRCFNSLLIPFGISSIFLVISELCLLLSGRVNNDFSTFFTCVSGVLIHLCSYTFTYFFVYMMTKGKRGLSAFWSVVCLVLLSSIISETQLSSALFLFSIIISLISIFCLRYFEQWVACLLVFVITLLLGALLILVDTSYNDLVMTMSKIISDKGWLSAALFGLVKNVTAPFNIDSVSNCIFYKSYGGSFLVGDSIVTGAKDLYKAGFSDSSIWTYLSGHYYVLFSTVGLFLSLLDELKGVQKYTLCIAFASSILSGNIWLFALLVFFECPAYLLLLAILGAGSYLVAYLLKLGSGYLFGGSIFELLTNLDKPVYLFAVGVVFVCIGYFSSKYIVSRFGISDRLNIYYPTRLGPIVTALGGLNNIVKVRDKVVTVRNPEIVDKIKLSCELDGNKIKSDNPLFIELIDYL